MLGLTNNTSTSAPVLQRTNSKTVVARRYELYISEDEIVLRNKKDHNYVLLIDRNTLRSRFIPHSELQNLNLEKPLPIYGLFGQIEISGIVFLVTISKAKLVATLGKAQIHRIESVKFLTVKRNHYKNLDYENCWDRLERIKIYLKTGFYFSYNYRLQSDFSGRLISTPLQMASDFITNPFVWNYKAIRSFTTNRELKIDRQDTSNSFRISQSSNFDNEDQPAKQLNDFAYFFCPIIQGFVDSAETDQMKIVLISRRSTLMGGTRYNSRGSDNAGNASNYVQSEMIVMRGNKIFTFSQIRGSIPFYWEQPKGLINPKTVIHQRHEINADLVQKHIKIAMDSRYSKLIFVNLLSRKRPEEDYLSRYLVSILDNAEAEDDAQDTLQYKHIDFHALTKQADFSGIDQFVYEIYDDNKVQFNEFDYMIGLEEYDRIKKQNVIARTNCLDCLDRTNAFQTKMGFYFLYKLLQEIDAPEMLYFEHNRESPLAAFEKSSEYFFVALRKLWADNGDLISNIYAGTGATTSSVTRKADQSTLKSFIDHKLKTLSRFYINNFDDIYKQQIIDDLLHKKSCSIRENELMCKEVDVEGADLIKISFVSIFSCLKNGSVSITEKTLESIFKNSKSSDVIVFITRLDKARPIQLIAEVCAFFDTFNELFKTLYKQLHGFHLIEQAEASQFEISIFALTAKPNILTFFKYDKVAHSSFSQSVGMRTSFIINKNGIELFNLKLEHSTFGYSPAQSLKKVFQRYIDKDYDLVLIAGYIEDSDLELDSVSENYELALQEVRKGDKDSKYSSHLILYCSKNVIQMENQPSYAPLYVDRSFLSDDLTINAHSFLINQPK